jgi:type VI secretion system secreted protein Hcp
VREDEVAVELALTLVGARQGPLRGSITRPDREGAIRVTGVDQVVGSVLDSATGQPIANRTHAPITVVKEVDASTPVLHSAWSRNERFSTWRLDFHTADATGRDVSYYVIELTGARVSRIHLQLPNTLVPANASVTVHESVSFVYDKIKWSWLPGNITAQDDWVAQQ